MFALSLFFFALSLKPQREAANQLKAYANEMIIVIEMTAEMTV